MSGRRIAFAALVACALCTAAAAREARGRWRFSIGPSVIGGVRPDLATDTRQMRDLSGFGSSLRRLSGTAAPGTGRSKEDAYAAGSGAAADGKRLFDGGAWYDPVDSGQELDGSHSWNWRLHDPSGLDPDGFKGFVERTAYETWSSDESYGMTTEPGWGGSDASLWFTGLRAEAGVELYRSGDGRPWGVDAAVAFAYYFKRDLWNVSGTAARATATETETHESGYYEWWNDSHDEAQYILDYYRDGGFDGSMWGAGSFSGPGPELASDAWKVRDVVTGSSSTSRSRHERLGYCGSGDYREYSIEMLARPWWEPCEWLRAFGSVGAEISRREFSWSMSANGSDGSFCAEGGEACDWCARGLLGGGLELNWNDFFVYGEALWRFGGSDLEVEGRTVRGSIGPALFGARVGFGYAF